MSIINPMAKRVKVDIINPNILRELTAKYPEETEKARRRFKKFEKWLKGEDFPTYNQLVQLSKIFGIPFGDLFLNKLPEENRSPVPAYERFEFRRFLIKDLKEKRKRRKRERRKRTTPT